jgi:hypothetical protein
MLLGDVSQEEIEDDQHSGEQRCFDQSCPRAWGQRRAGSLLMFFRTGAGFLGDRFLAGGSVEPIVASAAAPCLLRGNAVEKIAPRGAAREARVALPTFRTNHGDRSGSQILEYNKLLRGIGVVRGFTSAPLLQDVLKKYQKDEKHCDDQDALHQPFPH